MGDNVVLENDDDTLSFCKMEIDKFDNSMGGTNLLEPLKSVF